MITIFRYLFLPIALLFLLSCETTVKKTESIDGIWKSVGYGKILHIQGDNYAFYDETRISCLPAQQGKMITFGDDIQLKNDTLSVPKGTGIYYYTRLDELPKLCHQKLSGEKKKDPVYNFEVFANTVQEHFAYMEMSKINWDSLYAASGAGISPETTDAELYLALEHILTALKDNHGYIEPTDAVYEEAENLRINTQNTPETIEAEEYGDFQIAQMVTEHYLEEDLTKDSWLLQWGKMKNNIGYIQVKSMWLYADLKLSDSLVKAHGFVNAYAEAFTKMNEAEYISKEVEGVSRIMDKVMKDLGSTDCIILDVRFNGGGQDAVSLEILRRFNGKKIKVATKQAWYHNTYTKQLPIFLDASDTPYTNPVYLLTSQQSASATDFMALASLELKHVKRIGSHTSGALSDALEKHLPNGWYFSVSNEIYKDNKGICYESIGIPVNYELNYPEDRQTFFRKVAGDPEHDKNSILKAIQALEKR